MTQCGPHPLHVPPGHRLPLVTHHTSTPGGSLGTGSTRGIPGYKGLSLFSLTHDVLSYQHLKFEREALPFRTATSESTGNTDSISFELNVCRNFASTNVAVTMVIVDYICRTCIMYSTIMVKGHIYI